MEGLVRRQFSPSNVVGSKVYRKEYDMLSPSGEIILPDTWEHFIKPGLALEMRLWPSSESDLRKEESIPRYEGPSYTPKVPLLLTSGSSKSTTSRDESSSATSSLNGRRSFSIRSFFNGRRSRTQTTDEDE